jgi:hypothetical protein
MTLTELRSYRVYGLALFDIVVSVLGTLLLIMCSKRRHYPNLPDRPFVILAVISTIPIGMVFHVLTGTNTTLNHRLGLSYKPS